MQASRSSADTVR